MNEKQALSDMLYSLDNVLMDAQNGNPIVIASQTGCITTVATKPLVAALRTTREQLAEALDSLTYVLEV